MAVPSLPTAKLRIEDNASPGAGEGPIQIVRISDGQVFKFTLGIIGIVQPLNDQNALVDAVRRLESFSNGVDELVVEINTTVDFQFNIGVNVFSGSPSANHKNAFWGDPTDPVVPIQNVTITKTSTFLSTPVIKDVLVSKTIIDSTGTPRVIAGDISVKFQDVELFADGQVCFNTALGNNQRFGMFSFFRVQFDGTGKANGYATKWNVRAGYAGYDFRECDFTSAEEYYFYLDAPQQTSQVIDCTDSFAQATMPPGNGRGAGQFVQRASVNGTNSGGQPFFGGPPAVGILTISGNNFSNCNQTGGHAFRLYGHVGEVHVLNNTIQAAHGAVAHFQSDPTKGIHTTDGQTFDTPPVSLGGSNDPTPCSGTAWVTGRAVVSGNIYFPDAVTDNNALYLFEGCQLIEIGLNTEPLGVGPHRRYWFYQFSNAGTGTPQGVGPLDNLEVRFLSAEIGSPISATYPKGYVRYGGVNNSFSTDPNAELTNAEIDALEDTNSAYPPWQQDVGPNANADWLPGNCVLSGFALSEPAVITVTARDPASVDLSNIGIVTPRPALITVTAGDNITVQNGIIVNSEPAVVTVTAGSTTVSLDVAGEEVVFSEPAVITVAAVDPSNVQASAPASSVSDDPTTTPIVELLETGRIVVRRSTF